MNTNDLAQWASRSRPALAEAVALDLRDHLAEIRSRGTNIYGYSVMPGDPWHIESLAVAYNCASDISASADESEFTYFKYSVDEWPHMDHGKFSRSDEVLAKLNAQFAAAHEKAADDFEIDEFEEAYSASLLGAILEGMADVKSAGGFGPDVEYLVIWISDSASPIMGESVRRLNSPAVIEEFEGEFGSAG